MVAEKTKKYFVVWMFEEQPKLTCSQFFDTPEDAWRMAQNAEVSPQPTDFGIYESLDGETLSLISFLPIL